MISLSFPRNVKKPITVEGCYLYAFENSTKLFSIQIFKGNHNTAYQNDKEEEFHDECKMIFDLCDSFMHADSAYLNNVSQSDDSMALNKSNYIITAIAWRGDICLIGHGNHGRLTILKVKVNIGGTAFRFVRTIDVEDSSRIIDIEIFDDRMVAVTSESGNFEYCKIEEF